MFRMRLTKNFDQEEFACKCGCGFNEIALHFVQKLQIIRGELKKPMKITSGCRCPEHNASEGGKDYSAHMKGLAADIECRNSHDRFMITALAVVVGIKRIGLYPTFIHLDMAEDLPHPRLWIKEV